MSTVYLVFGLPQEFAACRAMPERWVAGEGKEKERQRSSGGGFDFPFYLFTQT